MVEKLHAMTATSMTWQETMQTVGKLNCTLRGWVERVLISTMNRAKAHVGGRSAFDWRITG
jgi:hypothetical protein